MLIKVRIGGDDFPKKPPPPRPKQRPTAKNNLLSCFRNDRSRSRTTEVRGQIYAQGPEEGPRHKREDHRFRAQVLREEGVRYIPSKSIPTKA